MADPSTYRPRPGEIPTDPGVYRFRDRDGRVIYVGKAKSLRSRLNSYFGDPGGLHHRTRTMVQSAAKVEWTVVQTETEALQLEFSWIKEFDPRFNVKYRDDKSYPYIGISLDEDYPRIYFTRERHRRNRFYFGPFSNAKRVRETLDPDPRPELLDAHHELVAALADRDWLPPALAEHATRRTRR